MAKKSSNSSKRVSALPLRKRNAKNAQASFAGAIAVGALLAALAPFAPPIDARAYPIQTPHHTPTPKASQSPTPSPPPNVLPYGSSIAFILDGKISSSDSKAGQVVAAHLAQPLVVAGVTLAPAGTPIQIKIVDASPASNPDVYGYVDIFTRPLQLPDGRLIPLRAPATHLNVNVTAGHESTVDVEDTIGDVYAPTLLYHIFRKGRNFTLDPGAKIWLRTEATLVALKNGTIAIETPAPLIVDQETPISSFRAEPMVTVNPSFRPPMATPDDHITPCPNGPTC